MHIGTPYMLDNARDFPGVLSTVSALVLAFNLFPTFQMSNLGTAMVSLDLTKLIPGLRSPASTMLRPRR